MNDPILRYNMVERVIHWIAAVTYCYVLLTGLAFYSPHLYWIATILGGPPTSRFWHPWIGAVFVAVLFWMLREWLADLDLGSEPLGPIPQPENSQASLVTRSGVASALIALLAPVM